MKNPDIQSSSILKPILYVFGGMTLLLSAVIAVTYIVYDDSDGLTDDEDSIFQRGLPSDFFFTPEEQLLTESDVIPNYLTVDDEEAAAKAKEIEQAILEKKRRASKKVYKKPVIQKVETVAEMFGVKKVNTSYTLDDISRDVMNKARLSSGSTYVQKPGTSQFEPLEKSIDEDWKRYGVKQDKASYPVDMSRVITADRYIRCLLIEEISSELEGKITCLVEENVYGSHGRFVLIPAGSKAIGYYLPLKRTGDERLFSGWNRLVTPDGINIQFTGDDKHSNAMMADAMGHSGLTGDVDNKYFEKYGLAFMVATLNALAARQVVASDANQQIVIENYGREISQLSSTILNENINIKPVVTIPAGSRILISPLVDIWFQKPKGKSVEVKTL